MDVMTPSRPYFVRALYDWILDNDCTPYLSVMADYPETVVPLEYVEDGVITLNVSASAVADFFADNDAISFKARFSGVSMTVYVPMGAVLGLYARETGQGMAFPEEPVYTERMLAQQEQVALSAVREVEEGLGELGELPETDEVDDSVEESGSADDSQLDSDAASTKKAPFLKVVK